MKTQNVVKNIQFIYAVYILSTGHIRIQLKQFTFEPMDFVEARGQFINTWGIYGQQWGINKAMGQIHALLLVSIKPICTLEIREMLQISSGNANTNIRALVTLGLLYKEHVKGDRKEYFRAEKDIGKIAKILTQERKRRGIDPVISSLSQLKDTEGKAAQIQEFRKVIKNMSTFALKADQYMEKLIESF